MKKLVICGICLLIAFAGCNLGNGPSKNALPSSGQTAQYTVRFSSSPVEGENITAAIKNGSAIKIGASLPKDTEVIFTAT